MRRYKHSKKRVERYRKAKEKKSEPTIRTKKWLAKAKKEWDSHLTIQKEAKKIFDYLLSYL